MTAPPLDHARTTELVARAQSVIDGAVAALGRGGGVDANQSLATFPPRFGPLHLADIGLVIGHAQVLAPVLRRNLDGKSRGHCRIYHRLVHALGVHVDLDLAPAGGHALEDGLPKLVAAFLHAALAVYPKGHPRSEDFASGQ